MRSPSPNIYLSNLKENSDKWDLFTKREEYTSDKCDIHGRFLYKYSRYRNVINPSVSQYIKEKGFTADYPDGKKFAIVLTHDVDDIYVPFVHILESIADFPKYMSLRHLAKFIKGSQNRKISPYLNFKTIIDLESRYDCKSSFYFMASIRDPVRYRYNIEYLSEELCYIVEQGWEVGLHVGYHESADCDLILNEKQKIQKVIGRNILGSRNHFLKFKVPDSWINLSKANILYDTTFGYSDMIGFRNGICHPFKPFNLMDEKEINILEIPLNVMDGTLFNSIKMSINEARDCIKHLIDIVEQNNGVLTILWHNVTFAKPSLKDWAKLYEFILKYGKNKNAWMTNGEALYKWWQNE